MRSSILAFAFTLLTPLVSSASLPARSAPEERICGAVGYDESKNQDSHVAYFIKKNDPSTATFPACKSLCTAEPAKCLSFAIGNSTCLLYTAKVSENFREDKTSPFAFFSVTCESEDDEGEELISSSTIVSVADVAKPTPTTPASAGEVSSNGSPISEKSDASTTFSSAPVQTSSFPTSTVSTSSNQASGTQPATLSTSSTQVSSSGTGSSGAASSSVSTAAAQATGAASSVISSKSNLAMIPLLLLVQFL